MTIQQKLPLARLEEKLIEWEALDIIPSEPVPHDINDDTTNSIWNAIMEKFI